LLRRHEKLASLGILAAGVAHEIRNPLTAIRARLFTLQKRLSPTTPERTDADVIDCEIDRLERIVKDFLLFARPSDPHFVTANAVDIIQEVASLLGPEMEKKGIRLIVEATSAMPVRIDPQQIKQVLINLVQNAAEAVGSNGEIRLRVHRDSRRFADRSTGAVVIEVQDSGKGIPPEVQERLFDPFFSTKEAGTGLGLSIAARIVEKHGGALQYQTLLNHGTTFGVVFPPFSADEDSPDTAYRR
jgi:signal transduction histidine kinase